MKYLLLRDAGRWGALALVLNLLWELGQLPLYTIWQADAATIAFAAIHCTIGDALIAVAAYGIAAVVTRSGRWPMERPVAGAATAIAAGFLYTVFSEWLNVYVLASWAYGPEMPVLYGIGVTPLLQWLVVPAVTLAVFRAGAHPKALTFPWLEG